MRKVIFTVTNDLNYDQRMHKICASLSGAGFDVLLVGRIKRGSLRLQPKSFRQKRLYCIFQKGKFFYAEYNFRLFWFLLFQRTHIICAIDLDTIVPCTFAGKLRKRKLVYDAHEYFTEVPEVIHRPAIQKAWQWVEKTFVPKMDACYTVGPCIADLYHSAYKIPFSVIMNVPLLTDKHEERQENEPKYILYQGALNKGRGLEMLIESMAQIPIKLLIAGEGDLSAELRKQVKILQLEEKVEFLGMLAPSDLAGITAKAYLGYNLLENLGKSYFYSLSNKFFDYIHASVPGISSNFPEYARINSMVETGILTNLCIPDIVLCCERVLKDEKFYRQLQENCQAARQIFNWQNEEKKLIEIYNAL